MKTPLWILGVETVGAVGALIAAAPAKRDTGRTRHPSHHAHRAPNRGTKTVTLFAGYDALGLTPHPFTNVESNWAKPKIDCTVTGPSLEMTVGFDTWKFANPVDVHVHSLCSDYGAPVHPDYFAATAPNNDNPLIDKPVQAGHEFPAKVTSDGKGNHTQYIKNETQGWDFTVRTSSPATTDVDADVLENIHGGQAPGLDPLTFFASLVTQTDRIPHPGKSIIVDANNKTLVDTSGIDANDNFTVSGQE